MKHNINTNSLRNSTDSKPQFDVIRGPAHSLLFATSFIVVMVTGIFLFSEISDIIAQFISIIFSFLNPILGLNMQTQGLFATINGNGLAIFYTIILILIFFSKLIFKEKANAITSAGVWLFILPLILYVAFMGYGERVFSQNIYENLTTWFFYIIIAIIIIITLVILTSSSQDVEQKINKTVGYILPILAVLWIVLLFASDSPFASGVRNDITDTQDEIAQETNNFATFWKCDIMQGAMRGDSDCIEVEEEVNVESKSQDSLTFNLRSQSSSSVIREGRESTSFIFDIEVPRSINAKILGYSCLTKSNRTKHELPSKYSSFKQGIEQNKFVSLELECPVMEKVSKNDDQAKVDIRIHLQVEDRISQQVPYIDCSHEFFSNTDMDCESIGRAFSLNQIDDPSITSFLNSISDSVTGAHSTRAAVSGFRGNLPLYLNSNNQFKIDSFDYEIKFREYSDFLISNISVVNLQTPQYISVVEDSLLESVSKRAGNSELIYPLEIAVNDFSVSNENIGGSESMLIDYIVNHRIESSKTLRVEQIGTDENSETISDVFDENGENQESSSPTTAQDTNQDAEEKSSTSCSQQCDGVRDRACIAECENQQEEINEEESPSTTTTQDTNQDVEESSSDDSQNSDSTTLSCSEECGGIRDRACIAECESRQ